MIYIFFSDIHSNLEAMRSVQADFKNFSADKFFCVGDIVGYGANPKECIDAVLETGAQIILGNHDSAASGTLGMEYFNEYAKIAIYWTMDILGESEKDFLRKLPLTFEDNNFTMVHGSLDSPEKFYYIYKKEDALETFSLMETNLCLIGHTHRPGIFRKSGDSISYYSDIRKLKLNPQDRYIINIGSVGQPRDGDPRASYAVFDTDANSIEIRRVGYDIKRAQRKITENGLPEILASRLEEGR